jgi:hypothetical protein
MNCPDCGREMSAALERCTACGAILTVGREHWIVSGHAGRSSLRFLRRQLARSHQLVSDSKTDAVTGAFSPIGSNSKTDAVTGEFSPLGFDSNTDAFSHISVRPKTGGQCAAGHEIENA